MQPLPGNHRSLGARSRSDRTACHATPPAGWPLHVRSPPHASQSAAVETPTAASTAHRSSCTKQLKRPGAHASRGGLGKSCGTVAAYSSAKRSTSASQRCRRATRCGPAGADATARLPRMAHVSALVSVSSKSMATRLHRHARPAAAAVVVAPHRAASTDSWAAVVLAPPPSIPGMELARGSGGGGVASGAGVVRRWLLAGAGARRELLPAGCPCLAPAAGPWPLLAWQPASPSHGWHHNHRQATSPAHRAGF